MDILNLRIDFLIGIDIIINFLQIRMDNFNLPGMDILDLRIIYTYYTFLISGQQRQQPTQQHTPPPSSKQAAKNSTLQIPTH
jgi:hypothetical protein